MPEGQNARIVASFSNQGVAELESGSLVACKYQRRAGRPVCGDYVQLEHHQPDYVVGEIKERRNRFIRADIRQRTRVVAATLDQAYNNRGLAHMSQHAYHDAIADFDRAITFSAYPAAAYNNRGNTYYDSGNWDWRRNLNIFEAWDTWYCVRPARLNRARAPCS